MKTIETTLEQTETRLFKADLKFMDFWHVSNDYLQTTSLGANEKKVVMIRIHDFSLQLKEIFDLYPTNKKDAKLYDTITAGLKESIRRAKISLALNEKHNKIFSGYWPFLVSVLKKDAELLKDEQLKLVLQNFEATVATIK